MASKIRQALGTSPKRPYEFDDDKPQVKQTKGLKFNNEKSNVQSTQQTPSIKDNVQKILSNEEEQMKIAMVLTRNLMAMMKDKTLDINKDLVAREDEKKVLAEYANFARLINTDPTKEDCYGTLAFVNAIARCLLLQRDRINELEYEVVKLRKIIEKMPQEEATNK